MSGLAAGGRAWLPAGPLRRGAGMLALVLGAAALGWAAPMPQPLVLLAVFAAALLASIAGFAFSILCAPLLLPLVPDPVAVVRILLLCSLGIQALGVWHFRRDIRPGRLLPYLLGSACTLPLGLALLLRLEVGVFVRVVGALALANALWALLRPPPRPRAEGGFGPRLLVGMVGGLTGGLVAAPGLALAVWGGWQGWPKEQQRAIVGPYILAMQLLSLAVLAWLGGGRGGAGALDGAALACLVPALLGASLGLQLFRRLSDRRFGQVVNLVLVLAGLRMLAG